MSTNNIYEQFPTEGDEEETFEEVYSELVASEIEYIEDPDELLVLPPTIPFFEDLQQYSDANRPIESYDQETGLEILAALTDPEPIPIGKTWAFDFNTSEFDMPDGGAPRKLKDNDEGIIQQWVRRCLTTERYAYDIYPDWFGVELEPVFSHQVVGPPALSHVVNTVEEALLQHDRITSVENIEVSEQDGTIFINCTIVLDDLGTVPVEVAVGG